LHPDRTDSSANIVLSFEMRTVCWAGCRRIMLRRQQERTQRKKRKWLKDIEG